MALPQVASMYVLPVSCTCSTQLSNAQGSQFAITMRSYVLGMGVTMCVIQNHLLLFCMQSSYSVYSGKERMSIYLNTLTTSAKVGPFLSLCHSTQQQLEQPYSLNA